MARTRGSGLAGKNALTVTIEAPGLDEMIAKLQKYARIGDTDAKRVRWGMNKTVKMVFGQAQQTTPELTGAMKGTLFQKVKVWGEGNVTGNVGVREPGAKKFALEGGRSAQAKRGLLTPLRFLWHAYSRVKDDVDAVWVKVIKLISEDLAKKGG
jgi:hypothetical protein